MAEHQVSLENQDYQIFQELLGLLKKYGNESFRHALERVAGYSNAENFEAGGETDAWDALDIDTVAGDSGIGDLASNHDHYLYGTPKKYPA